MASNRKKQDEKHLKILRNLVSLPGNKQCFDCNQRGPTYVNVTIGSFVCTTCSGFLRGLTPPHRVKSISMAIFTPEEIESLQSKGNEYCKKVWLALYDFNNMHNTKDEHLVRDFMVAKYEKKLYYLEPSAALKNGNVSLSGSGSENFKSQHSVPNSSLITSPPGIQSQSSSLKDVQPLSNVASSVPNLSLTDPFEPIRKQPLRLKSLPQQQQQQQQHRQQPQVQQQQQVLSQPQEPSFANFDNNPIFTSSIVTSNSPQALKSNSASEDKYAALKELDCLMKMPQESLQPQVNGWTANNVDVNHSLNPFQVDIGNNNVVNPFRSGLILQAEKSLNNNSSHGNGISNSNFSNSTSNNFNNSNPSNPWGSSNSPWSNNILTTSQSMPFPTPNWTVTGNLSTTPGNSNNPFL